jgi:S1-C subfamily serine protease
MSLTLGCCLFAAAVAADPGAAAPAQVAAPKDIKAWKLSVVLLTTQPKPDKKGKLGSGFLLKHDNSKRMIVTCSHVIEDAAGIRVDFPGNEWRHARCVRRDEGHDLAVMELNEDAPDFATPLPVHPDRFFRPADGTTLHVIGHPLGLEPDSSYRVAKVSATRSAGDIARRIPEVQGRLGRDTEVLELDVNDTHGGSGSPILDIEGRVVGVYQGGPAHGSLGLERVMNLSPVVDVV